MSALEEAPRHAGREPAAIPATQSRTGYAAWMLMLVGLFSIMDRQIVNILAELIRRDLDLSDTQVGLLTGFAFALFYTTLALPIARLAERRNRSMIIAASLALWSAFTVACGLAQSFAQLFAARILVGVGEAGSGPASQSLIADLFPRARRASALGLVASGLPLGTLIGMAMGGLIAEAYGWRAAFVVAGAPGIALAILVAVTLKDPRGRSGLPSGPSFRETLAVLLQKPSFWWFTAGSTLLSFTNLAFGGFAGSLLLRLHGAELGDLARGASAATGATLGATSLLGPMLGAALGLSGMVGVLLGGVWADAALKRDRTAYMTVAATASLAAGPLFVAAIFVPTIWVAVSVLALPALLSAAALAPVLASAQSVVGPQSRATAAATLFLVTNLVALGLGPLCVGALSDALAPRLGEASSLSWALAAACLGCPAAAACFWAARSRLAQDLVD